MAGLSNHYDCLTSVKDKLLTKTFLDLDTDEALPPSAFLIRSLPRTNETLDRLPAVLIAPVGSEMEMGTLLNHDDIGYPVAVVIVASANLDFQAKLETFLSWRQIIYRAFRNQRLSGVPAVWKTKTYPDVVFDPEAFNIAYVYSGLLFRFVAREERG